MPLKARSFSDALVANADKFHLEHCNGVTNAAGRRVWGFLGIEAVARPRMVCGENADMETRTIDFSLVEEDAEQKEN